MAGAGSVPSAEEPPADDVFPGPAEAGRVFAAYGCDILGPPPAL